MAVSAGTNIGPYRIMEPVGRGGMASVFKAYEASLDRYVALKVLPQEFLHDPTFAERFRREAQTIARLEHPQIIPIFAYDIDTASGTPWMAMRLISGGSLSQKIKKGRLAPAESARILKDVAEALDYAHSAGVIHRDVKPQNILLDDAGRVYLADFGIAKMVESSAHMTQTGMITGTPQYMAPEQALGKTIDKSIDIYALGIVAYELFTGRVPFSADTPVAVLMKQASEPMPLPPTSEVQEEVTRAILRATAKDPAARWPSAAAFAKSVENATSGTPSNSGDLAATSALPALTEATVQGMTAPNMSGTAATEVMTARTKVAPSASAPAQSVPSSTRKAGAGLGLVAAIVLGLGAAAAVALYAGYRYYMPATPTDPATEVATTVPPATPIAPVAETPAPPATTTSAAVTETTPAPVEAATPVEAPAPSTSRDADPRNLTPAERRALRRDPELRRAVVEEMRRRNEAETPATAPTAAARPAARTTKVILEVEASQPSTGSQISALYAQVLIDNRPFRDFVIRFVGGNPYARWRRIENITLDDVPLSAREITLAVATDPGLNDERMEGSTRLALEGEETNLSVAVRFYNQFDKSVKFR